MTTNKPNAINVFVTDEMRERLRLAAYQRRKSMSEIIRTALDEDLPELPKETDK